MFIIFLHHCSWYWDIAISRYLISWYGGFPPKRVNCLSMFASVYSSWWNRKLKGCTGDQVIIIIIIVCKYVYLCICVFVYLCIHIHVFQAKYSFPPGGWVVGEANFRPLTIVWTEIDTSSSSAGGATLFWYILQHSLAIILKYCKISSSAAKENGGDTFVFIVKSRGGPWSPNQVPIIWQTQHCWVNSVKR